MIVLNGPTLVEGMIHLFGIAVFDEPLVTAWVSAPPQVGERLVPRSLGLRDRVVLVDPDGTRHDVSCRVVSKAAVSAVGAKGSASAVDTVGDGDPCPKHRALGVNDGCPDCDPAVLS